MYEGERRPGVEAAITTEQLGEPLPSLWVSLADLEYLGPQQEDTGLKQGEWVFHQRKPLVKIGKLVVVVRAFSHHIADGVHCLGGRVKRSFIGSPDSKKGPINSTEVWSFLAEKQTLEPSLSTKPTGVSVLSWNCSPLLSF